MSIAKKSFFAILAATTLVAAYLFLSFFPQSKLEFRDRTFPQGFRDLVLESDSTPFDPLFGLRQGPFINPRSKPDTQEICDALFRDPSSPAIGNRDSEVQIVAFLDYRCPYCKKLTAIMSKMPDNVGILYKEWPILGDSSLLAARAGLAANMQGKYLAFHTRLMNSSFVPTAAYIEEIAVGLGMDKSQLRMDMNSSAATLAIQRTFALASALGLVGTPALVVGRTIAQGEITRGQLKRLIDDEIHTQSLKVC
jgi:protein-disulfide isomerase